MAQLDSYPFGDPSHARQPSKGIRLRGKDGYSCGMVLYSLVHGNVNTWVAQTQWHMANSTLGRLDMGTCIARVSETYMLEGFPRLSPM